MVGNYLVFWIIVCVPFLPFQFNFSNHYMSLLKSPDYSVKLFVSEAISFCSNWNYDWGSMWCSTSSPCCTCSTEAAFSVKWQFPWVLPALDAKLFIHVYFDYSHLPSYSGVKMFSLQFSLQATLQEPIKSTQRTHSKNWENETRKYIFAIVMRWLGLIQPSPAYLHSSKCINSKQWCLYVVWISSKIVWGTPIILLI